jgi:hypothetical protein
MRKRLLRWTPLCFGQGAEVVDGTVYVLDRNQITRLHDLDGDGEADFYENFNNDFLATHHFHEFTFDLDRDADGNFYFAKAARHALPARVDHHGVIMKLDPRGEDLEVVCRGFRVHMPSALQVSGGDVSITFTDPLDRASVEDLESYVVRRWNYRRSSRYGSDLFKLDGEQGTEEVRVRAARLSPNRLTVTLNLEDLREVDQMQLSLTLRAADGAAVVREISHTVNRLSSQPGDPVLARRTPSGVRGSGGGQ